MGEAKEGSEKKTRKIDDPFYRLDGYRDAQDLVPLIPEIVFPVQIGMFDGEYTPRGLMNRQGYCFEAVDHAFFGGDVKKPHEIVSGNSDNPLLSWFDILDAQGIPREVKSIKMGAGVKLMDHQVSRQADVLVGNDYPILVYDIFRHNIRGIQSRFGGQRDISPLFSEFRKGIRQMISIDFSIIFEAWNPRITKFRRYVPKDEYWAAYGSYTCLNGRTLTKLVMDPEEALRNMNLNPDDYDIERRKYSKGLNINGGDVSPFAIILIRHKSPEEWCDKFRKQDLKWLADYFERGNGEEEAMKEDDQGDINFDPEELERMPQSESQNVDDVPF